MRNFVLDSRFTPGEIIAVGMSLPHAGPNNVDFFFDGIETSFYQLAKAGYSLHVRQKFRWSKHATFVFSNGKSCISFRVKDMAPGNTDLGVMLNYLLNAITSSTVTRSRFSATHNTDTSKKVEPYLTVIRCLDEYSFQPVDKIRLTTDSGSLFISTVKQLLQKIPAAAIREAYDERGVGASPQTAQVTKDISSYSDDELLTEMVRRVDAKPKTKKKKVAIEPVEPVPPVASNVVNFAEILEKTRRGEQLYTDVEELA